MNPFDGLDDIYIPSADTALTAVAGRVRRRRLRRRAAVCGATVAVMLTAVAASAALGRDGNDRVQVAATSESSTTTRAPATTVAPTTLPPEPIAPPSTEVLPPATTTTTTAPDLSKLGDWSNVRIDAPYSFDIKAGESAQFEFTMHNDGPWPVVVARGCPWFGSAGSRVSCPRPIATLMPPGVSQTGVAIFYARHYQTPAGQSWNENDPWIPVRPSSYYAFGITRDLYRWDDTYKRSNAATVVNLDVFTDISRLQVTTDPADFAPPADLPATVTVTLTNARPEPIWDWGCLEMVELRRLDVQAMSALPLTDGEHEDEPALPLPCPEAGWREPGWSATRTYTVAAGAPGNYALLVGWQKIEAKLLVVTAPPSSTSTTTSTSTPAP